jgi:hypothetical protein
MFLWSMRITSPDVNFSEAAPDRDELGDIYLHRRSSAVHHRVDTSFTEHERNGAKGRATVS